MDQKLSDILIEIGRTDHSFNHIEGIRARIHDLGLQGITCIENNFGEISRLQQRLSYLQFGTDRKI